MEKYEDVAYGDASGSTQSSNSHAWPGATMSGPGLGERSAGGSPGLPGPDLPAFVAGLGGAAHMTPGRTLLPAPVTTFVPVALEQHPYPPARGAAKSRKRRATLTGRSDNRVPTARAL
jgi:hypothetical protein